MSELSLPIYHLLQWETPKNLLKMFAQNKIWLPPPQCYELLRLCQINDIDNVVNFAKSRNNMGITLQYPIYYEANDGAIFSYPGETKCIHNPISLYIFLNVVFNVGDDLYPTDPCFTHTVHDPEIYKGKSCEEIRALSTKLHRYELTPSSNTSFAFYMNIEPFNGHLSPIVSNLFD